MITDDVGRVWSVNVLADAAGAEAIVFTCVSDSRQPARALAADLLPDVERARDPFLLSLLRVAPRLGRLV